MHLYLRCNKTELTYCFSRQKKGINKMIESMSSVTGYTTSYWGFPSSILTFEVFEVTFFEVNN